MSVAAYQGFVLPDEGRSSLNRMLAVSVAVHVCLLAVVTGIRLTPKYERPMASYQVSLVTLPTPQAPPVSQKVEQPSAEPPSVPPPAARKAARPMAPKVAPIPALPPPPVVREVGREPEDFMQDVLRGIERPPEAPTLGALKPASPQKLRKEMDALMQGLEAPKDQPEKAPDIRSRKSLSEDLARLQPSPPVTAKAAPASVLKKPDTAIQVPGLSANRYLAQVQNKISSQWVAPPVDLSGRSFRVIIKFRLHRNGAVSDVSIETTSGNGYYDDAGRRAVLKADPLPAVPSDMSVPLDVHFSFTVGEEAG
jgi:colicin import membrane protein